MSRVAETTSTVLNRCQALGFALAGVAEVAPTRWTQNLLDWLEAGKHGEMTYLAEHVSLRIDPSVMLPGAKSILCVADRYHRGGPDRRDPSERRGRVARYARGEDYHKIMKRRLHALCDELQRAFPDELFRTCVDTAPVLEREHAQRAGIGAVGKNTLLIQPGVGSYLLLGEIITTLPLEASESLEGHNPCSSCTRCIDACPTDAITPWSVDATRCISYLTIEHRSRIDEQFHPAIGDWIFGCDICQEVCPHNQPTQRSRDSSVHDAYSPQRTGFDLLEVLNWDESSRREAFTRSSMKRAKLDMMKRNALIAAENMLRSSCDDALSARIREIADDTAEDEMVRATAVTVLDRLSNGA